MYAPQLIFSGKQAAVLSDTDNSFMERFLLQIFLKVDRLPKLKI